MIHSLIHEPHYDRIRLSGQLTYGDCAAVPAIVADLQSAPARRCLIDLRALDFIDSEGIAMLLVLNGEAVTLDKALALLTGEGEVRRVLTLCRIGMIVPVFDSLDAYLAASVPEAILARHHPCAPDENPLALVARALMVGA